MSKIIGKSAKIYDELRNQIQELKAENEQLKEAVIFAKKLLEKSQPEETEFRRYVSENIYDLINKDE